jgi:hypothetical protein
VQEQVVDIIGFERFKDKTEESLNEDPLFVLGCGHVYCMSTLDGIFELHKAYERQNDMYA